jgi:hypothetical protein
LKSALLLTENEEKGRKGQINKKCINVLPYRRKLFFPRCLVENKPEYLGGMVTQ